MLVNAGNCSSSWRKRAGSLSRPAMASWEEVAAASAEASKGGGAAAGGGPGWGACGGYQGTCQLCNVLYEELNSTQGGSTVHVTTASTAQSWEVLGSAYGDQPCRTIGYAGPPIYSEKGSACLRESNFRLIRTSPRRLPTRLTTRLLILPFPASSLYVR